MTDRPTPEQIVERQGAAIRASVRNFSIDQWLAGAGSHRPTLAELHEAGYRVVHPDDIPEAMEKDAPEPPVYFDASQATAWTYGWDACRRAVFGDDR